MEGKVNGLQYHPYNESHSTVYGTSWCGIAKQHVTYLLITSFPLSLPNTPPSTPVTREPR